MKLQISNNETEQIENFRHVMVNDDELNLDNISNNECEIILAKNVLNRFSIERIPEFVSHIVKKLRLKGTLIIGGSDIRLFSKAVMSEAITAEQASSVIKNSYSMSDINSSINVLKSLGLTIQSSQMQGIDYEITASR